jgi:hypothetical protein
LLLWRTLELENMRSSRGKAPLRMTPEVKSARPSLDS